MSTPPSNLELVDVLAECSEILPSTRRGACLARDLARANKRDFPNLADIATAATESGATLGAVAACWGYVRSEDKAGIWHDARFTYANPSRDDHRRGVLATHEHLLCLTLFSLACRCPIPFQFSYTLRRPKGRK